MNAGAGCLCSEGCLELPSTADVHLSGAEKGLPGPHRRGRQQPGCAYIVQPSYTPERLGA